MPVVIKKRPPPVVTFIGNINKTPNRNNLNKIETVPIGRTLYHGTTRFTRNFPGGTNGTWFATDPRQSILHPISSRTNNSRLYLYIYKTIRPLHLLRFDTGKNMNNWAQRKDFRLPSIYSFAFGNSDYKLAQYLCRHRICDGWSFKRDQSQVMLCSPRSSLRLVKIKEIIFPGKPSIASWRRVNNTGFYEREGNKFKLINYKNKNQVTM
jgi:hypothetical protein